MGIKEKYLDERFNTPDSEIQSLPFFHSCDAMKLQEILDSNSLKPTYCKVYKENLLYLFYGKPAYKPSMQLNSKFISQMPVCFIINHDAVTTIRRAVAFDSGAYSLYAPHLHESMKLEEFHLTPNKDALNKMVRYFYDSNDLYFKGQAMKTLHYDPIHFQLEGYHSIIASDHKTLADDRKATLEVQLNYEIPINSTNIEAIILPEHLHSSDILREKISGAFRGIKMIPILNYAVVPGAYYVDVLEKVRRFLTEKKLLNGN